MIARLYLYFGVVGMLSIAAWAIAAELLALGVRRRMHHAQCLLALLFAVAALVLAKVNSSHIDAIELDRHDEMAAMKKARQAAEAAAEGEGAAAALRFAEGDPEEQTTPDYKKRGKQVRAGGKRTVATMMLGAEAEGQPAPAVRYMRQADLTAANRLDRLNLLLARLVFWLAVGGVILDYLARLNTTLCRWPLPITGRWLDHLFDKTHSVLFGGGAKRGPTPRRYAELTVRKGESFIYFGERDPWAGTIWLPRIALGRWSPWRFPKLDYGDPEAPITGEFALDAAWFDRCAVVVARDEDCFPLFDHLSSLLAARHQAGASARRTVHLIWDAPQLPATEDLAALVGMAGDLNVKVAVWAHEPVTPELAGLFEERFGDAGK
jgi:hypothetical protein